MQLDATAHWCACSAHPQTGVQAMVWFCLRPTNNLSDIPSRDKFGLLQELNSTSGSWFDRASLATLGYDEPNVEGFGEPDVTEVANHA